MPRIEIDLDPVDFITLGTIGPKGQRVFYLQAGYNRQIVSLVIEKEQSWALSEAIKELIEDLRERFDIKDDEKPVAEELDMELREPIEPLFRVSQMGLGYDETKDRIVLVAQEMIISEEQSDEIRDDEDLDDSLLEAPDDALDNIDELDDIDGEDSPGVVRMWCSRAQMRALSEHAMKTVKAGRADPKQNGQLIYYWT